MRAFIAIDLPPSVRNRLGDLIRSLSAIRRGVKWCDPEQMHLTLKFFAELPESGLEPLCEAVARAGGAFGPVRVAVRATGSFGPRDRIRVVWAGVEDPTGALAGLQRAVEECLVPLGFPKEERAFHPHLTLGRLRDPIRDPALSGALKERAAFEGGEFLVDRLVLHSSVLTPSGPIYRAVHTWPLEVKS